MYMNLQFRWIYQKYENPCFVLLFVTSTCNEALGEYIKWFVILYTDDTIIMSETKEGMQDDLLVIFNVRNLFQFLTIFRYTCIVTTQ
jgi:hypothetical protein